MLDATDEETTDDGAAEDELGERAVANEPDQGTNEPDKGPAADELDEAATADETDKKAA